MAVRFGSEDGGGVKDGCDCWDALRPAASGNCACVGVGVVGSDVCDRETRQSSEF